MRVRASGNRLQINESPRARCVWSWSWFQARGLLRQALVMTDNRGGKEPQHMGRHHSGRLVVAKRVPHAERPIAEDRRPTIKRPAAGSTPQPPDPRKLTRRNASADAIISASLARAAIAMLADQPNEALRELEQTLVGLALEGEIPVEVWRIETVRAEIYHDLGKHDHARRIALVAYRNALRSDSKVGEARARELVEKLVAGPRRTARGTDSKNAPRTKQPTRRR